MAINTEDYFYHEATRKLITVFGAMFNNISTARKLEDGSLSNVTRVPLSYGPRSKFLSRINENNGEVLIKLPRMSFEISSLAIDVTNKLKKTNKVKYCGDSTRSAWAAVPYNIGFTLSVFGRSQDDMFQILEQILPHFSPDYTISIKGLEGPDTVMDVPFILESVGLGDEYEGDFSSARAIEYTLEFTAKIKYLGPISEMGIIENSTVQFLDAGTDGFYSKAVAKGEDGVITLCEISYVAADDEYRITLDAVSIDIDVGTDVVGETSGYGAIVKSANSVNTITVTRLDNLMTVGENLIDSNGNSYEIIDIEKI